MEFNKAMDEMGQPVANRITWEDCQEELTKVVKKRNKEYNESFNKARVQMAQLKASQYTAQHPNATQEEVVAYVKDYIDQAPDEFQRNLRTYCNLGGALFNQLSQLVAEILDFKEVYMALHEDDVAKYAEKHKEEIEAQRKAMAEAQSTAETKTE